MTFNLFFFFPIDICFEIGPGFLKQKGEWIDGKWLLDASPHREDSKIDQT